MNRKKHTENGFSQIRICIFSYAHHHRCQCRRRVVRDGCVAANVAFIALVLRMAAAAAAAVRLPVLVPGAANTHIFFYFFFYNFISAVPFCVSHKMNYSPGITIESDFVCVCVSLLRLLSRSVRKPMKSL